MSVPLLRHPAPPVAPEVIAAARQSIPHQAYATALLRELERKLERLGRERPRVATVFFGGGTPSLWQPEELGRVLSGVRQNFETTSDLEVTVECNPTSTGEDHFERLLAVGVNRVSIGVQAVAAERLAFLGRLHDASGGLAALRAARRAGMPRVSADLIFGVYRQNPELAVEDVQAVLETGIDHLSAYALTIEPNTRFGALHKSGRLPLLDEELVAQSFEAVASELERAGFSHYEVSNYARAGQECRHNLGYWRGLDYLGLGTGAVGTMTLPGGRVRTKNLLSPERYLEVHGPTSRDFDPFTQEIVERETIDPQTALVEGLLLGLRLLEGIDPEELSRRTGAPFWTGQRERAVQKLLERGLLLRHGSRLSIPEARWLLADGIIRDLL